MRKPSLSTILASLALFFSLVGAGWAVQSIPHAMAIPGTIRTIVPGAMGSSEAICPPGTTLTGGGVESSATEVSRTSPQVPALEIRASRPSSHLNPLGWVTTAINRSTKPQSIVAYAICLTG